MAGLSTLDPTSLLKVQQGEPPTPLTTSTISSSKTKGTGDGGGTPTINLGDFASLLNPKNVENCICCNTSLLTCTPPAFLFEKKSEILKSFCDILNLSCSPSCNNGEQESEGLDFPFCFYCTNHKIIKLTKVYERLLLVQSHFDQLKEAIMKDILRVFIGNIVLEKKIPLKVVRETRVFDRMFNLFKRHGERKTVNGVEKAVQTEGPASQFVASSVTPPVAQVIEVAASSWKRRRRNPRQSESQVKDTSFDRSSSLNPAQVEPVQYSPVKQSTNPPSNIPMAISSGESSCAFGTPPGLPFPLPLVTNEPIPFHETFPIDESVSFENAMNGVMFMLDENGLMELENGFAGIDFPQSFDTKDNLNTNGLSTIDQSTLSDEFNSVLGLMEGLDTDGSFSLEVEIPQYDTELTELIVGRKSSPQESSCLPEEFSTNEEHIVMKFSNQDGVRSSKRKIKVKCEVCFKVISKECLKLHMEKIHGDEKPHKCRGCDKRFARRDHHVQHEERHIINSKRIYFCHRCGKDDQGDKISGKTTYIGHCIKTHGIEDDVVEFFHFCDADECLESFKIRDDYLEHLETHWISGIALKCSICEKPYADRKRLEAHEEQAHRSSEAYYNCQFCYMGFEEESDFSRHIMFHKVKIPEERTHSCEICGKAFETQTRLRCHRYNVHNRVRESKGKNKLDTPTPSPIPNNYQVGSPVSENTNRQSMSCDVCGKVYRCKASFKRHKKTHQNAETVSEENFEEVSLEKEIEVPPQNEISCGSSSSETGKYECSYCSKKLKTTHEYRRHLVARHRDKHLTKGAKNCIVCWNIFPNEAELKEHCEMKHKKFMCEVCGKMSPNSLIMAQHMNRHNGTYPFNCEICKQGFSIESVLRGHVKKVHSREVTKTSSPSESDSNLGEEVEDFEELNDTLTPINYVVDELLNSHDPNSYDMLDLFQM